MERQRALRELALAIQSILDCHPELWLTEKQKDRAYALCDALKNGSYEDGIGADGKRPPLSHAAWKRAAAIAAELVSLIRQGTASA